MTGIERIVLQELRDRPNTTAEIAQLCNISRDEVLLQLRNLNSHIRRLLGYEQDAITISSSGAWKADGIAGLLRLNTQVELEVVPKFLDASNATWRLDFFLLAVLVRTGHLLVHDDISAGAQDRGDLATLIARSFLTLYSDNQRRPIRGYKRVHQADYAIDGEVEWESLVLPEPDGFRISRLELAQQNPYNATLAAAVNILIPEVADGDTQSQLNALARALAPQLPPPANFPPLPQRHSAMQHVYDLARLIIEGLGLDLKGGTFTGPGFVLSTWSAWQSLCEELIKRALPDHKVIGQKRWLLGYRGTEPVYATPDISPLIGLRAEFLLDAKYKTRLGRNPSIGSSDVYEALAFLKAADANQILLLYPSVRSITDLPLGGWREFDKVNVDSLEIQGHEIQIQGISRQGGFDKLVSGARHALTPRINHQ
ncbi:5-methylcytosine restriction system specificity protein McrC [Pseudarthrobacter oxydans]|uniref:5-methylcytosine restriction system specificity protein McrC n=1 Tax=Pseudarthrobacter oxydans TaxID=1671 RepID=UPI0038210AF7